MADDTIFKVDELAARSYEKDYVAQLDITFEVNVNQLVIARDGYTFLDFLSDIGGMQAMLFSGFGYLVAFWNYNHFDNFMVSRRKGYLSPNSTVNSKTYFKLQGDENIWF